jgi:hypothetical protein
MTYPDPQNDPSWGTPMALPPADPTMPSYSPGYASPSYPAGATPAVAGYPPVPDYATAPGYGTPPGYQPAGYAAPGYGPAPGYGMPGYPPYGYAPPRPNNGLGIAAMVVSLVAIGGLCLYGVGGLIGIVGAIMGHVAKRQIRENGQAGEGMAMTGIIVGWITTGLGLLILAAIIILFVYAARSVPDTGDVTYDMIRLPAG